MIEKYNRTSYRTHKVQHLHFILHLHYYQEMYYMGFQQDAKLIFCSLLVHIYLYFLINFSC